MASHPSNKVIPENVGALVGYHQPTEAQRERLDALAEATTDFIIALLDLAPDCADRSAAIRHAREAKMTAACAIVLEPAADEAPAPRAA